MVEKEEKKNKNFRINLKAEESDLISWLAVTVAVKFSSKQKKKKKRLKFNDLKLTN